MSWWVWVLVGWIGLAAVVAPLLGLMIREADRRENVGVQASDVLGSPVPARHPRRRIPVPPVAVRMVGIGVALEAVGFLVRVSGHERGTAQVLSMDLPLSAPRMYITAVFAAAAVAAFLGASRAPGRRAWWVAVGAVAAVVADVKGGGTVHVRALAALGVSGRPVLAAAGSAVVAGVVLAVLWWTSRTERRDRQRVLSAFAVYAAASVGLSGVSSLAAPGWSAAATFVEESGEAVGAVAVLVAVLVGVAPRLVLPAGWPLRRDADAETVDAPGVLPTWPAAQPALHG